MQTTLVNASCRNQTTCSDCLGSDLAGSNGCKWCASDGYCLSSNDETTVCNGGEQQCESSYYTIIFLVVLSVLVCLCCGTCCLRKYQYGDEYSNYWSPSFPQFVENTTAFLFRSSMKSLGENEWMCIICGFDNKPRSEYCVMCGTSHQFSSDYKTEKSILRKQKKEKEKEKKKKITPVIKDIKIPSEAQITDASIHSPDTLRYSLSKQQRAEVFNYRRLNQLTLRQKSARRRRMWQRIYDEDTDEVKWVRTPVAETKVGNTLFGYSPTNSFDGDGNSCGASARGYRTSSSEMNNSDHSNSVLDPLLSAFRGENNGGSGNCTVFFPVDDTHMGTPTKKNPYRKFKRDSFDDVVVSTSPGFTSVFGDEGELQWEQVESGKAVVTNRVAPINSNYHVASPNKYLFSPNGNSAQSPQVISNTDLESAAVLTFNEKQIWFLKHIETFQRPWKDGYVRFEVNKENILHDSCKCMLQLRKSDLHKWMRIQFSNSSGVDAGGLEREWFALVVAELFDPKNGLFIPSSAMDSTPGSNRATNDLESPLDAGKNQNYTPIAGNNGGGTYHINPLSGELLSNHLDYFQFAGRFLGKAVLEQQSINAPLSLPLRKQILSLPITFSDLEFIDDELYRNLVWLQTHDHVEQLELDFTVTYTYTPSLKNKLNNSSNNNNSSDNNNVDNKMPSTVATCDSTGETPSNKPATGTAPGTPPPNNNTSNKKCNNSIISPKKVTITKELKDGGSNILVSDQNKAEYLQLKLRHRMLDSIKPQLECFLRGFYEVIPGDLMSIFDYQELELLMCGIPAIDLADWKKHTEYLGEYSVHGAKHRVIKWFWNVLESFENEERVRLLQFTTGCSRLPPPGFKALQSNNGTYRKFNIQSISKVECPYPRAHTCFNKLDLPVYESKAELEAYLSIVVNMEATGFTMD